MEQLTPYTKGIEGQWHLHLGVFPGLLSCRPQSVKQPKKLGTQREVSWLKLPNHSIHLQQLICWQEKLPGVLKVIV